MNGHFFGECVAFSETAASLMILACWRSLPLLGIAVVSGTLLRKWFPSRVQSLLWLLVAVRLLLPVSYPTNFSLQKTLDEFGAWLTQAEPNPERTLPASDQFNVGATFPEAAQGTAMQWVPGANPSSTAANPDTLTLPDVLLIAITGIWACGVLLLILRSAGAHVWFGWKLRACRRVTDGELRQILLEECDRLRIRCPEVREVGFLSVPAVFGLFQPIVCLPHGILGTLPAQELRWILRHELAHVRQRDSWLLSIGHLMWCVHWVNPLAWFVFSRMRSSAEAAADECTLTNASADVIRQYGLLLLKFAAQSQVSATPATPALISLAEGRVLRDRIRCLQYLSRPWNRTARWLMTTLLIVFAGSSLSDAADHLESVEPDVNLPQWEEFPEKVTEPDAESDSSRTRRTYPVADVLQRARERDPVCDPEQTLLLMCPHSANVPNADIVGDELVAHVTEKQHQALVQVLDAWRTSGARQVVVEMQVISAEIQHADHIDWNRAAAPLMDSDGVRQPVVAATVATAELQTLVQVAQQDRHSNVMQAPKITLFNGQSGCLADGSERGLVTGVRPQPDGTIRPHIDFVFTGLKCEFRPVVTESLQIQLHLQITAAEMTDVGMANLPFVDQSQPGRHVTVQVPQMSRTQVATTVELSEGQSFLIAAPQVFTKSAPQAAGRSFFFAVTPRLIDPESDR